MPDELPLEAFLDYDAANPPRSTVIGAVLRPGDPGYAESELRVLSQHREAARIAADSAGATLGAPPPGVAPRPGILVVREGQTDPVYLSAVATSRLDRCDYCEKKTGQVGFWLFDLAADPSTAAQICENDFVMNLVLRYFRVVPALAETTAEGPQVVLAALDLYGLALTAWGQGNELQVALPDGRVQTVERTGCERPAPAPTPTPAWNPVHLGVGIPEDRPHTRFGPCWCGAKPVDR